MRHKTDLIKVLKEKKFKELTELSRGDRKVMTLLISLTYDKKTVLAWRAMEAIGLITGDTAGTDPERVRNTTNRLLWMMRDESGGTGWSVPEIIGEIVANNPVLCADFAPIIASFHDERIFTAGVIWAVGSMGRINDDFTDYAGRIIIPYLGSPSGVLRSYAARAAGAFHVTAAAHILEDLRNDPDVVPFYEAGELENKTVGDTAVRALEKFGTTIKGN